MMINIEGDGRTDTDAEIVTKRLIDRQSYTEADRETEQHTGRGRSKAT